MPLCFPYPTCAQIREKEEAAAGAMGDDGGEGPGALSSGITPKVQEVYTEIGASSLLGAGCLLALCVCRRGGRCGVEVVYTRIR